MDDRIDFLDGQRVGGAHPHAGLETVTFMLEGGLYDEDEGPLEPGDLVWMTAGSGVVHGERVFARGEPTRVLQLWIALPESHRNVPPRVEVLHANDMPVYRAPGVKATLYSGSVNGLVSRTQNYASITLLDLQLEAGATFEFELPDVYNGFLLPLQGSMQVGEQLPPLATGEIGWLARTEGTGSATLRVTGESMGCRVLLYAGHAQKQATVHHGPFVAGSEAAIVRQYLDYSAGRFVPISHLMSQKIR
jgi:redox-sensitive bicupin YhaK (pirin superfamily)